MVAVYRILVSPILASLYLLLTPVLLLVMMFVKDEEDNHEKEKSKKQTKSLESSGGVELHRGRPDQPMATVSFHRSAETQRHRVLVSASSEEKDTISDGLLRAYGPGGANERPETSIRRVRSKSVRHWQTGG